MSAETKAALDDAIAAHFQDESGALLTGYVLKMDGRSVEGIDGGFSNSRWEIPDTQSTITTLGLATALFEDVRAWYGAAIVEDDDDD